MTTASMRSGACASARTRRTDFDELAKLRMRAVSSDGVTWSKPPVGAVEFRGSRDIGRGEFRGDECAAAVVPLPGMLGVPVRLELRLHRARLYTFLL